MPKALKPLPTAEALPLDRILIGDSIRILSELPTGIGRCCVRRSPLQSSIEDKEALRRLGPTEWHRPGFAPVIQLEFNLAS